MNKQFLCFEQTHQRTWIKSIDVDIVREYQRIAQLDHLAKRRHTTEQTAIGWRGAALHTHVDNLLQHGRQRGALVRVHHLGVRHTEHGFATLLFC